MSVQVPLFEKGDKKASKVAAKVEEVVGEGFDVAKFVENFEVLVEAAGSTRHLKELILQLAIRGRLSSGRTSSANDVVAELRRERLKLVTRGIRLREDLAPIADEELPYAAPQGWLWVRMCELGGFLGGGTPSKANPEFWKGSLPWVSPKDMKRPYINDAEDHISLKAVEGSAAKLIPAQSILYVVRGMILAHSFPVALTTAEVTINQDMKALVLAMPELGEFVLRTCQAARARVLSMVERSSHGTCRLDSEAVEMLPIALPPLAEQKRIVAKVDQLMALCDELEAKQTKKRETGARLTKSALDALTSAEGPDEFDAAWKRVVENFDVLIDRAEKVGELRGAILELAASGQLVPVEAGSAARVRAAIERPGGLSRTPPASDWMEKRGILHGPLAGLLREPLANGRSVPDARSGFPVLRLSALRGRFTDFSAHKVGEWTEQQATPFIVREGDVLFVRGNGAIRLVGRACLVGPVTQPVAFPDTVIRARLRPDVMDSRWFWYVWESRLVRQQVEAAAKTTAGIFKVSQDGLSAIRVPVPTLPEQRRIVEKLEQLMKVCDLLEERLRHAEGRAFKLVEATVRELVA